MGGGRWRACAAACVLVAAVGCVAPRVNAPAGAAPLRYRDAIFASFTVTQDLQYGSAPNLQGGMVPLLLDLYQPGGDADRARAAVVWVHGGGFSSGDKGSDAGVVEPLVRHGFVVISINYRLLAPAGCSSANLSAACVSAATAATHDAQAAVRWLRANAVRYRIDPTRLGIAGFSAGGVAATGVGVMSDQPGSSGNPGYPSTVRGFVSVSGGLPSTGAIGSGDAAGYLFSGTADPLVAYRWSVNVANALDKAHLFSVLYSEQGVGHTMPPVALLTSQEANFFYREMDLGHAAR